MAMLFHGARSLPDRPMPSCESTLILQPNTSTVDNKRFTQLYLNSDCRLITQDTCKKMHEDFTHLSCSPMPRSPICLTHSTVPTVSCSNCDNRVCLDCIRACQKCGGDICVTCIQIICVNTEHYVCRDCS